MIDIIKSPRVERTIAIIVTIKNIKLKTFWNYIPPKFSPISENLVKEKFVCDSKVIISCGRKSVIPSIALKKRLGNEILLFIFKIQKFHSNISI